MKIANLIKGFTSRLIDSVVMGGIIHNINDDTKDHPAGKIDPNKLIRDLIITGLIVCGYAGKASELFEIWF